MVRPKDEEKRRAILEAALNVFAEKGIASTPTSAISKAATVAEGTLFTYFGTKDILINELYTTIKKELAEAMIVDFPQDADCRTTLRHVWGAYVEWGAANPLKNKVLMQLKVSEKLTPEAIEIGNAAFSIIEKRINDAIADGEIRNYSCHFMAAIMSAVAEATMAFIAQAKSLNLSAKDSPDYCEQGFELLWNGIAIRK